MTIHTKPIQCLANVAQQESEGGRAEFLEQRRKFTHTEPERPTGDCAVVALVHATFRPEIGQSYREARTLLALAIEPWMYDLRRMNEKRTQYVARRIKQLVKPPKQNPLHGTPTYATDVVLRLRGYEVIFPNAEKRWSCICDMRCTYVLDVQIPGDHTMAVHQQVAYTTTLFNPDETSVGNVYRLSSAKTKRLKAVRQFEEADRLWIQQWVEGDVLQLPNWESHPKFEDYLEN